MFLTNAIEVLNLKKKIDGAEILKNLNLSVKYGEVVGVIGHNGSGKTLLLRILCGLAFPNEGTVTVEGKILRRGVIPDNVGVIIESPGFLPHLTGFENLVLLATIRNKVTYQDIERTMDILHLSPMKDKRVRTYSFGMRQRLGIAQAIMEEPKVLLLDEPTNGLDPESSALLLEILRDLRARGTAVLWVSHEVGMVSEVSDRVLKLNNGELKPVAKGSMYAKV